MRTVLTVSGIQLRLVDGFCDVQGLLQTSIFMLPSTCHCLIFTWEVKTLVLRTHTYRHATWKGIWAHSHTLGTNFAVRTDRNWQDRGQDQLHPLWEAVQPHRLHRLMLRVQPPQQPHFRGEQLEINDSSLAASQTSNCTETALFTIFF